MAKLPPKTFAPPAGQHSSQNTLTSVNIVSPEASRICSGDSFSRKPSETEWIELFDPGQPFYGNQCVEGMYRMLFDNPSLYRAYYSPRLMQGLAPVVDTGVPGWVGKSFPTVKPMELTRRSAYQAAHSGLVKPHERKLVHVAAIVSPCGLLMATDENEPAYKYDALSWDKIASLRMYTLSKPLMKIKACNVEMGNTLAAVLGQSYEQEDVDFDQVIRLATAVRLSDTKLASYWARQIT